ncbi:hypothetical protein DERF_014569 [Dermatophagoides farinae]|uniref:Uncharacterized protein n=1 Tax=Dermatophagoides farinae TaxID=6954 RepID=A0A922KX26_DERFA|nr:hypothetical protein DERF_014550 [Dermatophagoides farinae]KAH9493840.1 hypothetical protein DERF_014569 [Dermatophagoides farinae]
MESNDQQVVRNNWLIGRLKCALDNYFCGHRFSIDKFCSTWTINVEPTRECIPSWPKKRHSKELQIIQKRLGNWHSTR